MKKKRFNIPVIISVLAVLLLAGIQYHLISNTYSLKSKDFAGQYEFFNNLNDTTDLSGILAVTKKLLLTPGLLTDSTKKRALYKATFEAFKSDKLSKAIRRRIKKLNPNLKYGVAFDYLFFREEKTGREEVLIKHATPLFIAGEIKEVQPHYIKTPILIMRNDIMYFELVIYLDLSEKIKFMFGKMWGIFALSFITIVTIVIMLIYTIRTARRHKKLSLMKSDFINNMTHELKTPLATIGVVTNMLNKISGNQSQTHNLSQVIQRQNLRLQGLIDSVLDVTMWEKNMMQLNAQKINMADFLKGIVQDFELKHQDIDIEVSLEAVKSCLLSIDSFHFTTVMYNLLDNAVKYSPAPAKIAINTQVLPEKQQLKIVVSDWGQGITKEAQKHIFDKFYREGNGLVHQVKGLGLGLYAVKNIITAHQGNISVQSKPGQGTTFEIQLTISR